MIADVDEACGLTTIAVMRVLPCRLLLGFEASVVCGDHFLLASCHTLELSRISTGVAIVMLFYPHSLREVRSAS